MILQLPADQATELAALAEAAWPDEACALLIGVVAGDRACVDEIIPARNVAATPRRAFELDPAVHIAALRSLRETGGNRRILGHWHSHPDGPAEPSATDAAMAFDATLLWAISAIAAGRAGALQAFRPAAAGGFTPITIDFTSQGH